MEQKINYITPAVTPLLPDGEVDLAPAKGCTSICWQAV